MSDSPMTPTDGRASAGDVKAILGALDEAALLEIMALRPSIRDVEDAAMWLSGDRDVFGPGEPLKGVAGEIVTVLTSGEEAEEQSPR